MGNRQMLGRVLARFREEYRDVALVIGAALESGELEQAQRHAHRLKGAAGMIEAHGLQRSAQALEQSLRQGGDHAVQLAQLEAELGRVMRALDQMPGAA